MIFIHSFLSLNQSNFSFPTHPSSMCLFCQSINQSIIVWFKVGSLLSFYSSINLINQSMKWNQPNQPTFISTAHSILNQPMSVKCHFFFFHSFFPSLFSFQSNQSNQSIKRDQLTDRQDRRTDIDEWMNEWIEINLTDKSIHVQLITESQFDLVWLSISFSN